MIDGAMGEILKKAQEMSQNMAQQQEALGKQRIEVSVGGEMIKMVFNGKQEAISITIDKEVVDPNDIQTLQDLILSAVNEGLRKSQKLAQDEMSKQLGGLANLKIPGFNL